jgi:hypothetical protein
MDSTKIYVDLQDIRISSEINDKYFMICKI